MVTIFAVYSGENEMVFGKSEPLYVCFEESERDQAEAFADANNTEVVEWLIPYRDLHELTFHARRISK